MPTFDAWNPRSPRSGGRRWKRCSSLSSPQPFEETVERLGTRSGSGSSLPVPYLPSERDLAEQLRLALDLASGSDHARPERAPHLVARPRRRTFVADAPPMGQMGTGVELGDGARGPRLPGGRGDGRDGAGRRAGHRRRPRSPLRVHRADEGDHRPLRGTGGPTCASTSVSPRPLTPRGSWPP